MKPCNSPHLIISLSPPSLFRAKGDSLLAEALEMRETIASIERRLHALEIEAFAYYLRAEIEERENHGQHPSQ